MGYATIASLLTLSQALQSLVQSFDEPEPDGYLSHNLAFSLDVPYPKNELMKKNITCPLRLVDQFNVMNHAHSVKCPLAVAPTSFAASTPLGEICRSRSLARHPFEVAGETTVAH